MSDLEKYSLMYVQYYYEEYSVWEASLWVSLLKRDHNRTT